MPVTTREMSHVMSPRALRCVFFMPTRSPSMSLTQPAITHRPDPSPVPPTLVLGHPHLVACEFLYCPLTPAQLSRKHTQQKLDALLLASPHELFPYSESPHITSRCALVGIRIDPREVEYHNFPIVDRSLPGFADFVRRIMQVWHDCEQRGRVAAVHCRGGIGRTGLIRRCWPVECGIARYGEDALRMIAEVWKTTEKCKRYSLSPDTGPHEYVRTFERTA